MISFVIELIYSFVRTWLCACRSGRKQLILFLYKTKDQTVSERHPHILHHMMTMCNYCRSMLIDLNSLVVMLLLYHLAFGSWTENPRIWSTWRIIFDQCVMRKEQTYHRDDRFAEYFIYIIDRQSIKRWHGYRTRARCRVNQASIYDRPACVC
jgi:hypothetical protein